MSDDSQQRVVWIKTTQADTIFGMVIMLNAVFIGVDVEYTAYNEGFSWWLWFCESCFLLTFVLEISMRIYSERPEFRNFFDTWGIFDFTVTVLGCIDTWFFTLFFGAASSDEDSPFSSFTVFRMFRLIRLVRLVRVLRMFNELVLLVHTIGNSMRAVAWMSLMLGMIMYSSSVVTVLMLGHPHSGDEDIQRFFGSLGNALFSHFCVVTLEGWTDIAEAAMNIHRVWGFYFIGMIILTNFALVNLMVGIIVERIITFSMEQENEINNFVAESEQFRETLRTLFRSADMDHSGNVSKEEIRTLLELRHTRDIMMAFGINLNIPQDMLHTIMNVSGDGNTTFEEFYDACMRMCGSNQSIHSVFVQHDICHCHQDIVSNMCRLEKNIDDIQRRGLGSTGNGSMSPGFGPRSAATAAGGGSPTAVRGSGGGQYPSGATEAALNELLDRMDRFGQVQEGILAEMHALKEISGVGMLGSSDVALSKFSQVRKEPTMMDKCGTELGAAAWCSSVLSPPKAEASMAATTRRHAPADHGVRALKRKELKAEFQSRAPGGAGAGIMR